MNNSLSIINSVVQTSNMFSVDNNNFNKFYNTCNKIEFAKHLAEYIGSVTTPDQDNNEKIAMFYFKEMMGL